MSKLILLKSTHSLRDVANLLGVKPAHLSYDLYKKPDVLKYTEFEIEKKSGGVRTISAPMASLKLVQRQLAVLLQQCSNELRSTYKREAAHGFTSDRSILTNAHEHRGRTYVFNLDLENFFAAINFGRVRGFFINDKDFSLDPPVATVLAQIACFKNCLPQGSPVSPVISNLIGNILDTRLVQLARKLRCTYTRYADDLTFSTNLPEFPSELATEEAGNWKVGLELQKIILHSGFTINASKVRMQYEDNCQNVTGLVVNQKANTSAKYRSTLRAMADRLFKTGTFDHEWWTKDLTGALVKQSLPGKINQLQGMLAHVEHVDQFNKKIRSQTETTAPGRNRLYKRFYFFGQFFAAPAPVILCEGKTDNVYLVHAIRSRAAGFPQLATINPVTGAIKIQPRLFKYVNRNAGKVLQLSGGQGELGKFITQYLYDVGKYFKAPGVAKHPVIILVDNDSGGKGPYQAAGKAVKSATAFDMKKPFERVAANLYLVPTPLIGLATESAIEDCFTTATLSTGLGGKKFNYKSSSPDESTEYGKAYFAEHVVKANAATIDFSGFDPLLHRIGLVLAHYATVPK